MQRSELMGRVCGRRLRPVLLAAVLSMIGGAAFGAPVLYFSDITSGPKTGNSDGSGGRVPGQNGAIVTVWGVDLGSARGSSKAYCNGSEAASYYFWGNASAPADLSTFHKMQMVSFQVSRLAKDGNGQIYVVVNGRKSNSLNFTVRSGRIYFVKTNGNDNSGNGSWSKPWRTIPTAAQALAPGDIAYIGNGVDQTTETDSGACVNLGSDGKKGKPKALVVYPGATSRVGNSGIERAFFNYSSDDDAYTSHWVVAKFTITTGTIGVAARTGYRVIGNFMTAPQGDGMDGVINVEGTDVFVLGNELKNIGKASSSKLYHGIYGKGLRKDNPPRAPTESNREIAWNYIHDCKCNRGINVYSEQEYAAFIERHRIHDNVIVNQRGDGVMLGYYVTGDNWIYNNLIVNAGLGPEWPDDSSYHTGIRINTGHEARRNARVYCYNNTLYGCGWSGAADPGSSGHLLISAEAVATGTKADFRNNIIYSKGAPYLATESVSLSSAAYRNCWFGKGAPPSWDTGAINQDPRFTSPGGKNFQLKSGSPCLDAGSDLSSLVKRDLLGTARPQGSAFDLGAYEYVSGAETKRRHHLR